MVGHSRKTNLSSIPPILTAWLLAVTGIGTLSACAARPPRDVPTGAPVALEYLDAAVYPPTSLGVPGNPLRMGSLSGLAFDLTSGRWLGASDDPSRPRLVWLDVSTASGRLAVAPVSFLMLTASDDPEAREALSRLDMESLVVLPDGSFAVTNEGHIDPGGVPHQPVVLHVSRQGVIVGVAKPRAHFLIVPGDPARGVRHNLGLEGLALMPDGRLVSGLEQPLAQDGPMSSDQAGGPSRLVEFVPQHGGWVPGREWVYRLDATPRVAGYPRTCTDGQNGLTELHALDDHRLIALERACLMDDSATSVFNPVRLYEVDLARADDVSSLPSLAAAAPREAVKRLLLDLTTLAPRLPVTLRGLSNFEGMAAGPPAPGARDTLLLVSDDNFRATQTLAFLWLRVKR